MVIFPLKAQKNLYTFAIFFIKFLKWHFTLLNSYMHNKSINSGTVMIYPKCRTLHSRRRQRLRGQGGAYRGIEFQVIFISHIKKRLTCFLQILRSRKTKCEYLGSHYIINILLWASLVAQTVKNLPAMQETQVRSLGREDPPGGDGYHSSTLVWRIPWTEEPGGLQSIGSQRVRHN